MARTMTGHPPSPPPRPPCREPNPHTGPASPPALPPLPSCSSALAQRPARPAVPRLGPFSPLRPLTQGVPPWFLPHLTHLLVYCLCPLQGEFLFWWLHTPPTPTPGWGRAERSPGRQGPVCGCPGLPLTELCGGEEARGVFRALSPESGDQTSLAGSSGDGEWRGSRGPGFLPPTLPTPAAPSDASCPSSSAPEPPSRLPTAHSHR